MLPPALLRNWRAPVDACYHHGMRDAARIREKILAGTLPKEHCHATWYGPGKGDRICVGCELPIAAGEVEIECDLPDGRMIRLHRICYEVWSTVWPSCEA